MLSVFLVWGNLLQTAWLSWLVLDNAPVLDQYCVCLHRYAHPASQHSPPSPSMFSLLLQSMFKSMQQRRHCGNMSMCHPPANPPWATFRRTKRRTWNYNPCSSSDLFSNCPIPHLYIETLAPKLAHHACGVRAKMTSSDLLGGDGEREAFEPCRCWMVCRLYKAASSAVWWVLDCSGQEWRSLCSETRVLVKSGSRSVQRCMLWSRVEVTLFRDACCGQEWRSLCSEMHVVVKSGGHSVHRLVSL